MRRFPILLTYFIDSFGLAIVFPVFTPLVLSDALTFFQAPIPSADKPLVIGFLVAAFPLFQFFGAPFLGALSDRIGRRKVFIVSIAGTTLGYVISALSIMINETSLLFIGRAWCGFFAGNLTLCLASLADLSKKEKSRVDNFSLLATISGLSFLFAIPAGGALVQASPSAPFWLTGLLSLVNLIVMIRLFKETYILPLMTLTTPIISLQAPLQGVFNLYSAFKSPILRFLYFAYFFFMLSWVTNMQFSPMILLEEFGFSVNALTLFFLAFGVIWSGSNFLINRILSSRYAPHTTALHALQLAAVALFSLLLAATAPVFTTLYIFYILFAALSWTNILVTLSLNASKEMQGRILGINQSVGAVAAIIGPSTAGLIATTSPHLILLLTSVSCFLSSLCLKKSSKLM